MLLSIRMESNPLGVVSRHNLMVKPRRAWCRQGRIWSNIARGQGPGGKGMNRPSQLLFALCLASFCGAAAPSSLTAAAESPVLAQDLKKLRAPGKVASVLWTRRSDHYTLQVLFPRNYRIPSGVKNPVVQAWLLKADGTLIVAARRSVSISGQRPGGPPDEVLYSIPLPEGKEAVAVALMIDSDYYIQELQPFSQG
jgi:hypothetical protein